MNWEVQTMPSKTSFCNGTEFRKCLSRWWPLWVIYSVILFILLPGVLLNARTTTPYMTTPYVSTEQIGYLSNVILSETQMLLPLTAFCAGQPPPCSAICTRRAARDWQRRCRSDAGACSARTCWRAF